MKNEVKDINSIACFLLCFFALILSQSTCFSQSGIKGVILSQSNEPVIFSSIVISQENLPDKKLTTISDLAGSFYFNHVDTGKYNISVSAIGFQDYRQYFVVKMGVNTLQNIILINDTVSISGVEIKSSRISSYADKKVYTVISEDRKTASNGFDIVKIIPQIRTDDISNKILAITGGGIKILINGIYADENDLMLLKPEQVYKIEYYNRPGARYLTENIAGVVNVITKDKVVGFNGYFSLFNAITTGFGNDVFGFKYTKKNFQISLTYNAEYRENNRRTIDEKLEYIAGGKSYYKVKEGVSGTNQYSDRTLEISFISNQKRSDLKLSFNINTFDLTQSALQNVIENQNADLRSYSRNQKHTYFSKPYLDIYYLRKLKNKNELAFNLVGSSFNSNYSYSIYEYRSNVDTIQYLTSNQISEKTSIISELYYALNINKDSKINLGIKSSNSWMLQKTESIENNLSKAMYFDGFIYSEFLGKISKISYTMGAGLQKCIFKSKSDLENYSINQFRPYLKAIYSITDKQELEFYIQRIPSIPSIGSMSNGIILLDTLLVNTGNPALKPYTTNEFNLAYTHSLNKITLVPSLKFSHARNPVATYFKPFEGFMSFTQINCKNRTEYNFNFLIDSKPFKSNWLRLQAYFSLSQISYSIESKIVKKVIPLVVFFTNITYKDFVFSANYQSEMNTLNGQTLTTTSSILYSDVKWKKKNYSIAVGIRYPFYSSYFQKISLYQEGAAELQSVEQIYNFANMLIIRFYYSFSIGKQVGISKILDNSDEDNGLYNISK